MTPDMAPRRSLTSTTGRNIHTTMLAVTYGITTRILYWLQSRHRRCERWETYSLASGRQCWCTGEDSCWCGRGGSHTPLLWSLSLNLPNIFTRYIVLDSELPIFTITYLLSHPVFHCNIHHHLCIILRLHGPSFSWIKRPSNYTKVHSVCSVGNGNSALPISDTRKSIGVRGSVASGHRRSFTSLRS